MMEALEQPWGAKNRGIGVIQSIFPKVPGFPRFVKSRKAKPKQNGGIELETNGKRDQLPERHEISVVSRGSDMSVPASEPPPTHNVVSAIAVKDDPRVPQRITPENLTRLGRDCYVDIKRPLPSETKVAWDKRLKDQLYMTLAREGIDMNFTCLECQVVGFKEDELGRPTILITCLDSAEKKKINDTLKKVHFKPGYSLQIRVEVLELGQPPFQLSASVASNTSSYPGEFEGSMLEVSVNEADGVKILFGNVSKFLGNGYSSLCTIGGVVSVDGTYYGLTTAHVFAAEAARGHPAAITTGGPIPLSHQLCLDSVETKTDQIPGFAIRGHVAYARWPNSAEKEGNLDDGGAKVYLKGEDWALVALSHGGMICNTFHAPGVLEPQHVTGYFQTKDLVSGDVWVCGGVSGIQAGFLSEVSASLTMADSRFNVRSISLEHSLADGDSGSWVVRNGKLCGLIFCRIGGGIKWAYMLPIESIFDSISQHWQSTDESLPSPDIQVARENALDTTEGNSTSPSSDLPSAVIAERNLRLTSPKEPPGDESAEETEHRGYEMSGGLTGEPDRLVSLSNPRLPKTAETSRSSLEVLEGPSGLRRISSAPSSRSIKEAKTLQGRKRTPRVDESWSMGLFDEDTPPYHGVNSDTIEEAISTVVNETASATFEQTSPWDQKPILSLDGGGLGTYSSLLVLKEIMRAIREKERTFPQGLNEADGPADSSYHPLKADKEESHAGRKAPKDQLSEWLPSHYFDYIAGAGTGGILSIMLGRLRMNIDDCISEYESLVVRLLGHGRWFSVTGPLFWPRAKYDYRVLEDAVKEMVLSYAPEIGGFPGGRNFTFDENGCKSVVLAYQSQNSESQGGNYIFRTYNNFVKGVSLEGKLPTDRNLGIAHEVPIWQVAHAASAMPGYFEPITLDGLRYSDASFFGTNNPCEEIYREVRRLDNQSERCIRIIVSIGTGNPKGTARNNFVQRSISRSMSNFLFIRKFNELDSTHHKMKRIQSSLEASPFKYYRLDARNQVRPDEIKSRSRTRTNSHPLGPFEIAAFVSLAQTVALRIPSILALYRNKTFGRIRRHTDEYIHLPEIQGRLREIADILVESRRLRARSDLERWEKKCFGTWYQCNIHGCPRAQKKYGSRREMQGHLLDKHGLLFPNHDQTEINKAVEQCAKRITPKSRTIPPKKSLAKGG